MKIPPIPAHTHLCHRNYEVAKALIYTKYGVDMKIGINPIYWNSLKSIFINYLKETEPLLSNDWEVVEKFFHWLKEQKSSEDGVDGKSFFASCNIDYDDKKDDEEIEKILNLADPKDRVADMLTTELKRYISSVEKNILNKNIKKINEAVEASFSFQKSRKTEADFSYRKFDVKNIDNLNNISRIQEKYFWGCEELETLMWYRAINGELSRLSSMKPEKKALFIMLDNSGSMDDNWKKLFIAYILLKIREKLDNNTEAYLFLFVGKLYENVYNLKIDEPRYDLNGGGTDIEKSLIQLYEKMKKFKLTEYSILIINDGEDNVKSFTPPCKVSAIMLGIENQSLVRLCKKSGGIANMISD